MNSLDEGFEQIEKALRPEVTKEQLYMLVNHLHEAIECLIDDGMDEMEEEGQSEDDSQEMEGMPDMADANPDPIGDPNKNDVNWPVAKSVWDGKLDPTSFVKHN